MPVVLRPHRLSDLHDLVAAANHPAISMFLRDHFPYPYTVQDAYWWLTEGIKSHACHLAITVNEVCIGSISVVFGNNESHLSGEIGYWLGRDFWGRGYATDAVRQMTERIFAETELLRIFAHVFAPNNASKQVLLKCGYQEEGVLRQAVIKHGDILDVHVYARLRNVN